MELTQELNTLLIKIIATGLCAPIGGYAALLLYEKVRDAHRSNDRTKMWFALTLLVVCLYIAFGGLR